YDLNGNETSKTDTSGTTSYTWGFENRLTQVTLPASAERSASSTTRSAGESTSPHRLGLLYSPTTATTRSKRPMPAAESLLDTPSRVSISTSHWLCCVVGPPAIIRWTG